MTQFNQILEKKIDKLWDACCSYVPGGTEFSDTHEQWCKKQFRAFAQEISTKASMEILARAVEFYSWDGQVKPDNGKAADEAIAQVKANGDWPLEEK